jgi:hypothetical protein
VYWREVVSSPSVYIVAWACENKVVLSAACKQRLRHPWSLPWGAPRAPALSGPCLAHASPHAARDLRQRAF